MGSTGREGLPATEELMLPHELLFVRGALAKVRKQLSDANLEYGDAVSNSGGDWAFDDPASQAAALSAHMVERRYIEVNRLSNAEALDYPDEGSGEVAVGSRVGLNIGGEESHFDIMAVAPTGIPEDGDVMAVSISSPMVQAMIGAEKGDTVKWQGGAGAEMSAIVTSVDQIAQKSYFLNTLGVENEQ